MHIHTRTHTLSVFADLAIEQIEAGHAGAVPGEPHPVPQSAGSHSIGVGDSIAASIGIASQRKSSADIETLKEQMTSVRR